MGEFLDRQNLWEVKNESQHEKRVRLCGVCVCVLFDFAFCLLAKHSQHQFLLE